jgi:hypothetical protein
MRCFHPDCPMAPGQFPDWQAAASAILAAGRLIPRDVSLIGAALKDCPSPGTRIDSPTLSGAALWRLLAACPCLYTQLDRGATADAVVHLCEITLGQRVISANVEQAFAVQYPPTFKIPPARKYENAGAVSEALCAEVLTNEGLPPMKVVNSRVVWSTPGFINLNRAPLHELGSFGDFLIPAAPSNIIISCKTQAARERLLNSGIRVDTVGFGFMDTPSEFWTRGKMNTLRRFGFTAIYLPQSTYDAICNKLGQENRAKENVNVNGIALYRALSTFGRDMRDVCGSTSLRL